MATSSVPQTAQRPADPFGADDDDEVNQRGDTAKSGMERLLGRLPGLLSSKPVIIFGIILFFYLFVFAGIESLLGHPTAVTANTQLILGNYTNVSSSVGAGIAAGAGLTLIKRQRHAHRVAMAAHRAAHDAHQAALDARAFAEETHRLCHFAMPDHAAALGQVPGRLTPAAGAAAGAAPDRAATTAAPLAGSVFPVAPPGAAATPLGAAATPPAGTPVPPAAPVAEAPPARPQDEAGPAGPGDEGDARPARPS
jgi:hypothetical protein